MARALVALVALALAFPAAAVAQAPQTNAPPGNSAIDEYLETVPGASGNTRPDPRGQSGGSTSGGDGANGVGNAITPAQRARLERLGPDGTTLANAVDATSKHQQGPRNETAGPKNDGRSPARAVLSTVTGSDGGSGMGIVLPAILITALLLALFLVLLRRRAPS